MKKQTTKIKLLMLALLMACIGANAQSFMQVLSVTGPGTNTWTNSTGGTVTVRITARGGDGGRNSAQVGGSGATEQGEFTVANGETIRAIAGGAGGNFVTSNRSGGGGGGSGAVNTTTNALLLIAGGAGGGRPAGGGQGGIAFNGSNQGTGFGGGAAIGVGGGGGYFTAGQSASLSGGGQISYSGLSSGGAGTVNCGAGGSGMGGGSGGYRNGLGNVNMGGNGGGYTGGGFPGGDGLAGTSYNTGSSQVHTNGCDGCGGNPAPVTGSVVIEVFTVPCTAPTITCPANQTVSSSSDCNAVVNYTATATGTSPVITYSFAGATSGSGSGDGSGSVFYKGTTTVTLTVTNSCGNQSCSFNVVVIDNQPPAITCAGPVIINNTPGECTGTTTLTAPTVSDNCSGDLSNAIKCDGNDDYIESSPLNIGTSDFTIEFWVNQAASGNYPVLFAQDQSGLATPAFRLEVTNGSNNLLFAMSDANGSVAYNSTTPLITNTWTHIAVVRSGNTFTTYLNGLASGSSTASGTINVNSNTYNFRIGARRSSTGTASEPFNGTFDEFRIWNLVRTPSQLTTNMNAELTGSESGLIRYYKFNQGTAGSTNTGQTTAIATTGSNAALANFALNGTSSNWVAGYVNSSIILPTLTNDAPATYPIGNTTVTWTATDASGNTATCNQTVTVIDNQAPTITAPANTSLAANSAGCSYSGSTGNPVLNDNCSGVTSSFSPQGPYAIGNTLITWIVTDASGNTASATQTITVLPIATSAVVTIVKCKGSNTGEIDLTVSQSSGALSYIWNTGSTNQDVSNLFAGNYSVTVTNSNGCTKTATFSITQPAAIMTISISKTNVRCGGKSTGEIIASGTGGVAPYTYVWGNGSTADTRSNLPAVTYTVTVTDAAGCSKTKSVTITQNPPQSVSVIPMISNQYLADNAGGVPPYAYYWNTAPAQTTQTATIVTAGSNYKVKVTDSKGCTVISSTFAVGTKLAQSASTDVGLAVMPNPTTGVVTLTVSNCINCNVLVNMFDAIGQQVYSKGMKVENNTTLDFSGLPAGIYTMRVMYDGRSEVVKIVIQAP